jgi:hypothetical protein
MRGLGSGACLNLKEIKWIVLLALLWMGVRNRPGYKLIMLHHPYKCSRKVYLDSNPLDLARFLSKEKSPPKV